MMWVAVVITCLALADAERLYPAHQTTRGRHLSGERIDPNDMYVRIEAEVLKLTNDKGVTSVNSYCDTLGQCDPVCYAHLDTDRPNAEWPGGVDVHFWPEIARVDNVNSPTISKYIRRDSCAKPYREAVLRVYCEDYDPASHNDLINQWTCPINRSPGDSETSATWASTADCTPKFHPGSQNSIRLNYRYRVFLIPKSRCDSSQIASTPRSAAAVTATTRR